MHTYNVSNFCSLARDAYISTDCASWSDAVGVAQGFCAEHPGLVVEITRGDSIIALCSGSDGIVMQDCED